MSKIYEDLDQVFDEKTLKSNNDPKDVRSDPSGEHPTVDYVNASGVNKFARGSDRISVHTGGSVRDVDLDLIDEPVSTYTKSQVKQTASGHIVEYDDTPGGERVMIRHRTGSGVEMRADGSVIYSSTGNTIRVTTHDEKVIVEGDGELTYNGNLKLKVAGDFDLEVGGDFNLKVDGDVDEKIKRGVNRLVAGSTETEILGNKSETVVGASSSIVFGDKTKLTKGDALDVIQGNLKHNIGKDYEITAEEDIEISSLRNITTASKIILQGDSGTIGGAEVVMYADTAHIPRVNVTSLHATQGVIANVGMTAPTFNGNLAGNANTAGTAGTAAVGTSAGSAQSAVTFTSADNKDTRQPNATNIFEFLNQSPFAIKRVDIDDGDFMKNEVDKSAKYGGVSKTELSTKEARSKLRDPNNLNNSEFIGAVIADGIISANFAALSPTLTDRTAGKEKNPQRETRPTGKSDNPNELFT